MLQTTLEPIAPDAEVLEAARTWAVRVLRGLADRLETDGPPAPMLLRLAEPLAELEDRARELGHAGERVP